MYYFFFLFYYLFSLLSNVVHNAIDNNYIILSKNISKLKYTSTFNSFIHSVIICIIGYLLYPDNYDLQYNNIYTEIFIQFYLTYFLQDIYRSYKLKEYHFIIHHLISIMPGIMSLYYHKYGNYVIIGLFNAELTNPFQQLCLLIKFADNLDIPIKKLFLFNNIFFVFNRTFITPVVYYNFIRNMDNNLIFPCSIIALLLYIMSFYWSVNLMIYKILPNFIGKLHFR